MKAITRSRCDPAERKGAMLQNAFNILSLSGEAVLCTRGSVIQYANSAACALLGDSCVGRTVREIFGDELNGVQSSGFITDFALGAKRCTARFSKLDKGYLIFLSHERTDPAVMNDPMLFSMRSSLMNMGIVTESMRLAAEKRGDAVLLRDAASLTQCYFRLMRQVENAGFVLELMEGENALNLCALDLGGLCSGAAEALAPFFPQVTIDTVIECTKKIVVDPTLVKLMLSNLLENCMMHADCAYIRLRLSETPSRVMLSVSDDGCGIPYEQLHKTFDRYRYGFDAHQMGRGPGLGLSVARGVAQLHGGTLLLESRPGKGTSVRVTLSKSLPPRGMLREAGSELFTTHDLLIGFADCLPPEAFSERFLD